jgi:phytol kinase
MTPGLPLSDPALCALSFAWVGLVIVAGETFRRAGGFAPDLTRKIVHVGVAAWALPTALWFDSPWWAAACPLVFVVLNALSYRWRLMAVIEEEGRGNPGTIYFPIAFALLILVLWPAEGRAASVAGLYAMGFGDAAASIIGRRWGRHRYAGGGSPKSWEGSAAMFTFSFAFILLGTEPLVPGLAWIPSLAAAVAGTLAEAPAGRGLDNLTVPFVSAAVFRGLS